VVLSGSGGMTTTGTSSTGSGAGAGAGSGRGAVAHAASTSNKKTAASCRRYDGPLITETNTKDVDLGSTQTTAKHIQLVEIVRWPNVHSMVITVVYLDPLDVGFDAV